MVGWIHDVWLEPRSSCVAALEICEADRLQVRYVRPFAMHRSVRYGLGIDVETDTWCLLDLDPRWTSVRKLEDVTVISPDGEWSCVLNDAECDPDTWLLTSLRIRRAWWKVLASGSVSADRLIDGSSNLLVIARF
jgi:hypothetical protein